MKKIIIFTASEIRHNYFRVYLSNDKNIKVLKAFSEKGKFIQEMLINKKQKKIDTSLEEKHLSQRDKVEKDFFKSYLDTAEDFSNNIACNTGYISSNDCFLKVKKLNPDLIVVYGSSLLKGDILKTYKNKILNVHLGLSPYYRGAGTNYFPFVNNEPEYAGATFMFLDSGVDTGEIIHQIRAKISIKDTFHEIGNKLILDMFKIYSQIIKNFEKIIIKKYKAKPLKEFVYKKKDFTKETVIKLNDNFSSMMIKNYLNNKLERDNKVPLVTQDWI